MTIKETIRVESLYKLGLCFDGSQFIYKEMPSLGINVHWIDILTYTDKAFSQLVNELEHILKENDE